jgi:hypothetical protein
LALAATVSLSVAQGGAAQGPNGSASPGHALALDDQALVRRYCLGCHSDRLKTANLNLEGISTQPIGSAPAVWEKVVRKLRSGAMPPAGLPGPKGRSGRFRGPPRDGSIRPPRSGSTLDAPAFIV